MVFTTKMVNFVVCKLYLNVLKRKERIRKLWDDRRMARGPNPPELQAKNILVTYIHAPSSVTRIVRHWAADDWDHWRYISIEGGLVLQTVQDVSSVYYVVALLSSIAL